MEGNKKKIAFFSKKCPKVCIYAFFIVSLHHEKCTNNKNMQREKCTNDKNMHREKCTNDKNMHHRKCKYNTNYTGWTKNVEFLEEPLNKWNDDKRSINAVHERAVGLDISWFQAVFVRIKSMCLFIVWRTSYPAKRTPKRFLIPYRSFGLMY